MNSKLPDFRSMLRELVELPSVSSTNDQWDMSNRGVVEKLAEWLDQLGFEIEIQSIAAQSLSGSSKLEKFNLVATKTPRAEGSDQRVGGLVLAGHTDTVPWDENRWTTDPFKIDERDNRFYGLGSTDMKGFFPVVLEALKAVDLNGLAAPLKIVATADEESSMSGAEHLLSSRTQLADFTVIGEPTDLKPIHMHKGMMMESIQIHGQSGHSSDPSLGLNAMEVMHRVMDRLLEYRQEIQEKHRNPGFTIPVPTMNLGCIHGGDNPNRICGHCELQFDLRPVPGMSLSEIREQVNFQLAQISRETGAEISLTSLFKGIESFEQPAESELVQLAEAYSGRNAESVAFATEAPFFQQLGAQTIVLGPGSINQAHQPDEFLPQVQIQPAMEIYQKFIRHFCFGK